jgi:hypothetical protein
MASPDLSSSDAILCRIVYIFSQLLLPAAAFTTPLKGKYINVMQPIWFFRTIDY